MIVMWFILAYSIGVLNMLTHWWTVGRLRGQHVRHAKRLVVGGVFLRLLFSACIIIAGLRQDLLHGFLAFGGLELARWTLVFGFARLNVSWDT